MLASCTLTLSRLKRLPVVVEGDGLGGGRPVNWPACSPDLSCLDFFLWGHMKSLVYASLVDSDEALVARIAGVSGDIREMQSVFAFVRQSLRRRCTAVRKVGGGRPITTTVGDDRYIILQAKRGRRQSASVIAQQLSTATRRQVSRFTVARRLHKGSLFARRPERCLPLKVDYRRHRLQWCREHKNWTTVNGVVSSLRMTVGSVPEAILNAF
ncbi:transposable element Tcb2 transposase [Trichonephila clavipes]|nr:transposable element Tcb2 transposase [Trichonephila clavipes]